ncbi:MAG: esterase/lipase family protein [Candidatus Kariarchaeaceae archaeon]|jgi:pimeloyl-ACP methyl ester carboxylesterase
MKRATTIQGLILIFLCVGLQTNTYPSSVYSQPNLDQQEVNPVLFLHGWGGISFVWRDLIKIFETDGWPSHLLYAYDFDNGSSCTVQSNINNAQKIQQWVDEILDETGAEKIDLVGHSMGGLSSRYYIKFLGGIDKVDDYVSISTPQHGENYTTCGTNGVNDFAQQLNEGDETPGGMLNDTLGIRQDPVFPEITYTGSHVPGTINFTSIYVNGYDGSFSGESCPLDGAHNVVSEFLGHLRIIQVESTYILILPAIDGPFLFENITFNSKTSSTSTSKETPWFELLLSLCTLGILVIYRRKRY